MKQNLSAAAAEKASMHLLMNKMGLSKKEFNEIRTKYGVDASRLLELMQLSKYPFVYTGKAEGLCEPCRVLRIPA